ncbi:LLM class flavin-dependent oxidoreductase [Nocardia sp. NBC_00416]|uniref:LLM class flavin-dependent oxidoreductase n=1 Tax=Nocardia sp. NBC_00416 TaxID=2975991 RepID=UPI002E251B99
MRIGIGLPSAVPGATPETIGTWAAHSEQAGFASLGATDRLVYDSLDPLVTLAVAAAHTTETELVSTVLNIGYRGNPFVVASQLASLDRLSGGRLTAGLGMGAWQDDYTVSEVAMTTRGARFESALAQLRRAWRGELAGAAGPVPALPPGRPQVLLAGMVPAGIVRAAALADGWVAPAFSVELLRTGLDIVGTEWARLARPGRPRVLAVRYFQLGADAVATAESYAQNYYGPEMFPQVRPDLLTDTAHLCDEVFRIAESGADDVILLPCSGDPDQIQLLADALGDQWLGAAHRTPATAGG